jgi:hypothetical protein
MADSTRYQDIGVGYNPYPITPSVDPVGARSRASLAKDIGGLLDRMGEVIYKREAEEAQRAGLQWGAQNPVTVEQLNAAITAGNDPLAERNTVFGDAARKVQAAVLSNQLNAQGIGEMARIQASAEVGQIPLSVAAEKMDAISSTFARNLMQVDPETGIKLRAALTSHSSSVYSHLAQQEVKKFQAAQKAQIDAFFVQLPKSLETEFLAGDTVDPATGVVMPAESRVNAQRAQAVQAARITGDAGYATKFDKVVAEARIGAYTRLAVDSSTDMVHALAKLEAGNLGPAHAGTWNVMTEEEKTKVKDATVKAFAQRYDVVKKRNDADALQAKEQTQALLLEYWSPGTTSARQTQIQREVRALGTISPSDYKTLIKGDGEGMTPEREATVADMIDTGQITTFEQLRKVASGKALVRLQKTLRGEGNQEERRAEGIIMEAVAGTKSPISALNYTEQQEKYSLQNRYRAEIAKARADGKPFSYSDIANRVASEYKDLKFTQKMQPQRDRIAKIEMELSKELGREVSIKTQADIVNLEKMGAWSNRAAQKTAAMNALKQLNAPVLIPETPEQK